MASMFGIGFQRLESALIAREQTQGVLSSNIANADTPNYQADSRTFADFLAEQNALRSIGKTKTTHSMHFEDTPRNRIENSVFQETLSSARMDGNSVDIQKEMVRMSENQLMHEMTMRLIKGRLSGIANAIKEGNR